MQTKETSLLLVTSRA